MNTSEIYGKLDGLFRDIIGDDHITLRPDMTAEDVDGWDSLAHIRIIVGIETEFGVKFRGDEMEDLKNVGELVEIIKRHTH